MATEAAAAVKETTLPEGKVAPADTAAAAPAGAPEASTTAEQGKAATAASEEGKAAAAAAAASSGKKRQAQSSSGGDAKRQKVEFSVGDRGVFFTTVSSGGTGSAKHNLQALLEREMEDSKPADVASSNAVEAGSKQATKAKRPPMLMSAGEVGKGSGILKFMAEVTSSPPSKVVAKMLETQRAEFQATRIATSARQICRVLPIDHTCKPYVDDFRKLAQEVLPAHVGPDAEPTVWALEFKARNTNTLKKEGVLEVIDSIVPKGRHKVSINDPAKCILVEVNAQFCGLSVVEHWAKLKKYNLSALCTEEVKKDSPAAKAPSPAPAAPSIVAATEAKPEASSAAPAPASSVSPEAKIADSNTPEAKSEQ